MMRFLVLCNNMACDNEVRRYIHTLPYYYDITLYCEVKTDYGASRYIMYW